MPPTYVVQARWVRDMYVQDAQARRDWVTHELEAQTGTEIVSLDWTVDAAKRCLNVAFSYTTGQHPTMEHRTNLWLKGRSKHSP